MTDAVQALDASQQEAPKSVPDWLHASGSDTIQFDFAEPFKHAWIDIQGPVQSALDYVVMNFRPLFQAIRAPVDTTLNGIQTGLSATSAYVLLLLFGLIAWQVAGWRLAVGGVLSLTIIGAIGAWDDAVLTFSLIITSLIFCILIGLPIGIWLSRSDRGMALARPILDAMQTTPAFVYLVPVVMLFGIGNVPGVIVTIIFALPPLVRLTNLGIRQVPEDLIEAALSFGASPTQLLFKVQLPLALPTIMAGINQTLMMSLSMVVVGSMIAVAGLGQLVLRGIGALDMGLAVTGGLGIVLLAIVLDRLTQALGRPAREKSTRHWYERGPARWIMLAVHALPRKRLEETAVSR